VIATVTVTGELDIATAPGLAERLDKVASAHPERLVLDLAGLAFLDAAGARALAAVTRAAPPGCPVIVRAISPAAGRLLRLLQLNLEHPQPGAPAAAGPAEHLAQRARAGRAQLAAMTTDLHRTVLELARTEDRLATTFARMAVQYPHRAAQLTALVTAARQAATRSRHLTGHL
jgi:anti-anti-sigma factor